MSPSREAPCIARTYAAAAAADLCRAAGVSYARKPLAPHGTLAAITLKSAGSAAGRDRRRAQGSTNSVGRLVNPCESPWKPQRPPSPRRRRPLAVFRRCHRAFLLRHVCGKWPLRRRRSLSLFLVPR